MTRIVQGNKETLKRNRAIYDDVVEATAEFVDMHPSMQCVPSALDDMCADEFSPDNLQLSLYMDQCPNLNSLSDYISEYLGTDCYIGFTTGVGDGESYAQFTLHINAAGVRSPAHKFVVSFLKKNQTALFVIILLIIYFKYL